MISTETEGIYVWCSGHLHQDGIAGKEQGTWGGISQLGVNHRERYVHAEGTQSMLAADTSSVTLF